MLQYSREFLEQLDNLKNKEIYAKVIALTFNENPVAAIEGRVTAGSINVDGSSAVRRTCQLTVQANDFNYSNYLWGVNTKFKLEIGIKNTINFNYPDIIWFKQGVYVLTSFNVSHSTTSFTINLSGKDKMCLLNGELGGNLESSIDFGQIEEEDKYGNWIIKKIPIQEIIKNAVHVYGKEPYHNIIINGLDAVGVELLEYRYTTPMYLYRSAEENNESFLYDNVLMENDTTDLYIKKDDGTYESKKLNQLNTDYLESLTTTLTNDNRVKKVYTKENINGEDKYIPYYFTKIEYGQTAGYRETDLTYPGDLIAKVGETLTSILDKIKNMLVEYEYFYNLEGQFVFQKKQSFISTMWSPSDEDSENEMPSYLQIGTNVSYTFFGGELITSFNNNPNIANLKNDYSIWGERKGISGATIPIHLRYAIDKKPVYYKNYNGDIFTSTEMDWREIIYQMAIDYYQHNLEDDFELKIRENNLDYYPTGRTGYESYYTDIISFWRDLYYPEVGTELTTVTEKCEELEITINNLQEILYGTTVDQFQNKLGGMENNIKILNNYLFEGKIQDAIDQANTFTDDIYRIENIDEISEDNIFSYVEQLRVLFFQKKGELSSMQEELKNLKKKEEKLSSMVEDTYYKDGESNQYWNKNVFEKPDLLNFWFDFLEPNGPLGSYMVQKIGARSKTIQDTAIKSIYFRETPKIIFFEAKTRDSKDISNDWLKSEMPGYRCIQVPSIETMFTISSQGKAAKEKLDELLYQHSCCTETGTLTTIPIYYLQPNTRIKLFDNESNLNGDYIINKITIPLSYNGTMTLQITKAIQDIV